MGKALDILYSPRGAEMSLESYRRGPRASGSQEYYELARLHSIFVKNGTTHDIDELTFQDVIDEFKEQYTKIKNDSMLLPQRERDYLDRILMAAWIKMFEDAQATMPTGFLEYLKEIGGQLNQSVYDLAVKDYREAQE